jgi:cytochrome c nitrite reductase small subunit
MIQHWLQRWKIPTPLAWLLTVGAGICLGVGGYTFLFAHGLSYVSNDPAVCANCHVMQPYYDGWVKGTHHGIATCNDCHTPHDLVGKYLTKADNGFHHSKAFTLQNYPDQIQIRKVSSAIVEQNCLRCHADLVGGILDGAHQRGEAAGCVRCHGGVGHGLE